MVMPHLRLDQYEISLLRDDEFVFYKHDHVGDDMYPENTITKWGYVDFTLFSYAEKHPDADVRHLKARHIDEMAELAEEEGGFGDEEDEESE